MSKVQQSCTWVPNSETERMLKKNGPNIKLGHRGSLIFVLGRVLSRTLRNVYGVGSPTVGPTSSVHLNIYVP